MGTLLNNALTKYADSVVRTRQMKSIVIAKAGENYFKSSFDKKGFSDGKWQERKSKKDKHPLMVKSGTLKNEVANSASVITPTKVVFSVDLPYAAIHNYGGTIRKKKTVRAMNFRIGANGRNRFATLSDATFQQDVTVPSHTINMPRRTFMMLDSIFINKALSIWQNSINKFVK